MSIKIAYTANRASRDVTFLHPVAAELSSIREIIFTELSLSIGTDWDDAEDILGVGSKRLRPSLMALCARVCSGDYDTDRLANIAAAAELVHMATMVHNNVVDSAELKRTQSTTNPHFRNQISVLTGDYMLARAFSTLSTYGSVKVIQVLSDATIALTEGEVRQVEFRGDSSTSPSNYESLTNDKTSAYMSACCRIGAILADSDAATEEILGLYGNDLGMAFQITDDLLDLTSGDIGQRNMTLPLILTIEKSDMDHRPALESMLHSDELTRADIDLVRRLAEDTGAAVDALSLADKFAHRAAERLAALPASDARNSLEKLALYAISRIH